MSTLAMPRLAREMAESNRRIADSVEAASLPHSTSDSDAIRRKMLRSARTLTRLTLSRKSDARDVWEGAIELLKEGVTGEEAIEVIGDVLDLIASWLRLARQAREQREAVLSSTGNTLEGLEDLDVAEEDVREVQVLAEQMHAFLNRQRQPVDLARFQKGREDVEQGRFKTPEQMGAGPVHPKD